MRLALIARPGTWGKSCAAVTMHNFSITVWACAAVAHSSIASVIAVLIIAISDSGRLEGSSRRRPARAFGFRLRPYTAIYLHHVWTHRGGAWSKCSYFGHSTIDISSGAVVVQNLWRTRKGLSDEALARRLY